MDLHAAVEAVRRGRKPKVDLSGIEDLLREVTGEAFLVGVHEGGQSLSAALKGSGKAKPAEVVIPVWASSVDWASWSPGDGSDAADLAADDPDYSLAALLAGVPAAASSLASTTSDLLETAISDGLDAEEDDADLEDAADGVAGSGSRGLMIALTVAAGAAAIATVDTFTVNQVEQKIWVTDGDPCPECVDNEDEGPIDLEDSFPSGDTEPPGHPNCVLGATPVVPGDVPIGNARHLASPGLLGDGRQAAATAVASSVRDRVRRGVRAVTVRDYVGDFVILRTSLGHELTITPNHPVATPSGWVAAGLLQQGDQVLYGTGAEWVSPDEDDAPPSIEQIAETGSVSLLGVPVAAEDFHGDGAGSGEVDVVRPDGLLRDTGESAGLQLPKENNLSGADVDGPPLVGEGTSLQLLGRGAAAANGEVGGGRLGDPLSRGEARVTQSARLGETPRLDALPEEPLPDRVSVDPEDSCQSLLALSSEVSTCDLISVERQSGRHERVFNMETTSGWYFAAAIVVHNCMCDLFPVWVDQ